MIAQLPNYLADPAFKNLYDANPYYDTSRAVMPRAGARQRLYARPAQKKDSLPVAAGTIDKADPLLKELLEKTGKV